MSALCRTAPKSSSACWLARDRRKSEPAFQLASAFRHYSFDNFPDNRYSGASRQPEHNYLQSKLASLFSGHWTGCQLILGNDCHWRKRGVHAGAGTGISSLGVSAKHPLLPVAQLPLRKPLPPTEFSLRKTTCLPPPNHGFLLPIQYPSQSTLLCHRHSPLLLRSNV